MKINQNIWYRLKYVIDLFDYALKCDILWKIQAQKINIRKTLDNHIQQSTKNNKSTARNHITETFYRWEDEITCYKTIVLNLGCILESPGEH